MRPTPARLRARTLVPTAALAAVLVLAAQAAWASFNDVNGSPYVDQISDIANAGCASGFNDGSFRPRDATTRGQFAFWMANCGGRARTQSFPVVGIPRSGTSAGTDFETTFRTPGVPGEQGHLLVTGWANASTTDGEHCPCHVQAQLQVNGELSLPLGTVTLGPDEAPAVGTTAEQLAVTDLVAVPTATTVVVRLHVTTYDADVASVSYSGEITALYVPFNGTPTVG